MARARKKKARPTSAKAARKTVIKPIPSPARQSFALATERQFPTVSRKTAIIGLIILAVLLLGWFKKSWFVAATVNGLPITTFEVLNRLNEQYRTQTLNQMINEKLIRNEIDRNNIVVTDQQLSDRVAQLEASFGGKDALDNLLLQQRQTRGDLARDLRLQLAIEKLYGRETSVSAEEVDEFISENKDQLTATEAGLLRKEAEDVLRQQKTSQIFNEKFQELKQNAKITIF